MARKSKNRVLDSRHPLKLYSAVPNKHGEFPPLSAFARSDVHQTLLMLAKAGTNYNVLLQACIEDTEPRSSSVINYQHDTLMYAIDTIGSARLAKTTWLVTVAGLYEAESKKRLGPDKITTLIELGHIPCPSHLAGDFEITSRYVAPSDEDDTDAETVDADAETVEA